MSQQATSGGSSSSSPPVWEGNGEPPEGFLPRNAKASSKQTTHETTGDDNLPMDCVFEWKVKNFEKIVNDRVYSEIQCFGNFKWCGVGGPLGHTILYCTFRGLLIFKFAHYLRDSSHFPGLEGLLTYVMALLCAGDCCSFQEAFKLRIYPYS
jgi:hypothetical protein